MDRIYSSAMVRNAQASAISVVNLIMNAELDNLRQPGPDGQLRLAVDPSDMQRLDVQMHRYLKPFSMHKIKMYTPDKKIIYSTDVTLIGKIDKDNQYLDHVMASGQPFSELQRKKVFVDLGGGKIADASIVEAYAPTFDASPLLSGQKSNKINWLEVGAGWLCKSSVCKAHETWVFSKTETDKICRQV